MKQATATANILTATDNFTVAVFSCLEVADVKTASAFPVLCYRINTVIYYGINMLTYRNTDKLTYYIINRLTSWGWIPQTANINTAYRIPATSISHRNLDGNRPTKFLPETEHITYIKGQV